MNDETSTDEIMEVDILVIGGGTAGPMAAVRAKEMNPDLILMDIMLEDDVDGIDAVSTLQSEQINIPVIFITGNSDAYNRERANAIEYVDYLVKPINYNILKDSVDKVKN